MAPSCGPNCDAPRPCRRLECRYVLPRGKCTWDVVEAHNDGCTLEEIGEALGGITRQAVDQIIRRALGKVHRAMLREEPPAPPPRAPGRPIDPYDAVICDPYGGGSERCEPYAPSLDPYEPESR